MRLFLLIFLVALQALALDKQYRVTADVEGKLEKEFPRLKNTEERLKAFYKNIDPRLKFKHDKATGKLIVSGEEENLKNFEFAYISALEWKPKITLKYELFIQKGARKYVLAEFDGPVRELKNVITRSKKTYGSRVYESEFDTYVSLGREKHCEFSINFDQYVTVGGTVKKLHYSGSLSLLSGKPLTLKLADSQAKAGGFIDNIFLTVKVGWKHENSHFYKSVPREKVLNKNLAISFIRTYGGFFETMDEILIDFTDKEKGLESYFLAMGLEFGKNSYFYSDGMTGILMVNKPEEIQKFQEVMAPLCFHWNSFQSKVKLYKISKRGAELVSSFDLTSRPGMSSSLQNGEAINEDIDTGLNYSHQIHWINGNKAEMHFDISLASVGERDLEGYYSNPSESYKTVRDIPIGKEAVFQLGTEYAVSILVKPMAPSYDYKPGQKFDAVIYSESELRIEEEKFDPETAVTENSEPEDKNEFMNMLAALDIDMTLIKKNEKDEIIEGGPVLNMLNAHLGNDKPVYRLSFYEHAMRYGGHVRFPKLKEIKSGTLLKQHTGILTSSGDHCKINSNDLAEEEIMVKAKVSSGFYELALKVSEEVPGMDGEMWQLERKLRNAVNKDFVELLSVKTENGFLKRRFLVLELEKPVEKVDLGNSLAVIYNINPADYPMFREEFGEVALKHKAGLSNEMIIRHIQSKGILYAVGTAKQHDKLKVFIRRFRETEDKRLEIYEVQEGNIKSGVSVTDPSTELSHTQQVKLHIFHNDEEEEGVVFRVKKNGEDFSLQWIRRTLNKMKTDVDIAELDTEVNKSSVFRLSGGRTLLVKVINY